MRAVLLTGEQPNQRALANKLEAVCELGGIVLSRNIPARPPKATARIRTLLGSLQMSTSGRPLRNAWLKMQADCAMRYPALPTSPRIVRVNNVNNDATRELIAAVQPDVVAVSGTNLIGNRLIAACAGIPILNLHTGISPYVKGGPNCTNWCLAEQMFHLIGSTVMWLDSGIDTGDIVATERTPLTFGETLDELHTAVMDHAHDLYVRSMAVLKSGRPLARAPQSHLGPGRTFYSSGWNGSAMRRARRNFEKRFKPVLLNDPAFRADLANCTMVPLPA